MNRLLWILLLIDLMGCAHMTAYEKCNLDDEYKRYGSMEQCLSEKPKETTALQRFFKGFNETQTMNQPVQRAPIRQTQVCTSDVIGSQVYTTCN